MRDIRKKSIDYLSRREHSRWELKQKLSKHFPPEEINDVLDFLIAHDLQSDKRFAACYVRSRKQAGFGPNRIAGELRERGVDPALIAEAVDEYASEWQTQLRRVWERHFTDPGINPAKQFRFLASRGFAQDEIRSLLFSMK